MGGVKSQHPCGEIRRINVEIPSLSVSDMRRLKATKYIGGSVHAGFWFWDGRAHNTID